MLKLSDRALDWALKHSLESGDTDIFPDLFEFRAMEFDWKNVKAWIHQQDILAWTVRPARRCLVPKHRFGFRLSTQLDPLDFLVYTGLIREVGDKLEASRIPAGERIVHSYRFSPKDDGHMFSQDFSFRTFQQSSHDLCETLSPSWVVVADIADFFPRLYTHRIDNALENLLGSGHMHSSALRHLISQWAGAYSYGIPVGSDASRLIAEVTISDIDQLLLSEGAKYVRYSDDFRVFCESEAEAYKYLTVIARALFDNHGLTLQQNKTKIVSVGEFMESYLRVNEIREIDTLSERFHELLETIGIDNLYGSIDYESLSPDQQSAIDELNLEGILREQVQAEEPDLPLMKFLLRRLAQIGDTDALKIIVGSFHRFIPVIRETMDYIVTFDSLPTNWKADFGKWILHMYREPSSIASHLEYSRMHILRLFTASDEWGCSDQFVRLYNEATEDFARREIILAMGRSGQAFWFRSQKHYWASMTPWVRRAFVYGSSCLPKNEYKHWIFSLQNHMDCLEKAIAHWAKENPIR